MRAYLLSIYAGSGTTLPFFFLSLINNCVRCHWQRQGISILHSTKVKVRISILGYSICSNIACNLIYEVLCSRILVKRLFTSKVVVSMSRW
ncbi:hypothetical protein L1887_38811 [Cichorium endivia]|nr:hypothetical protein L1887_38811 [Cichorium endivia]